MAPTVHAWVGEGGPRGEVAEVDVDRRGRWLVASGTQLDLGPAPYRLDYRLVTHAGFATAVLEATCGPAAVRLEADGEGRWTVDGRPAHALDGALDVDLGRSPLTNTLPVLRAGLLEPGGPPAVDLAVAWVAVPTLTVEVAAQRYERVGATTVRYSAGSFAAVLDFDADGVVVRYPGLAARVGPG